MNIFLRLAHEILDLYMMYMVTMISKSNKNVMIQSEELLLQTHDHKSIMPTLTNKRRKTK